MELEEIIRLLISAGAFAGVAAIWQWWRDRKADQEHREVADVDQVRALLKEDNEEKERRIRELEHLVTASVAEKDLQLLEQKEEVLRLRADVALCQRDHAETRVVAATLTERLNAALEQIAENKDRIALDIDRIADLETLVKLHSARLERREQVRGHDVERRGTEDSHP